MSGSGRTPDLFPDPSYRAPTNVTAFRNTGIIPYQGLRAMIAAGELQALGGISEDQLQPASIDLRLGTRAYRVRASFLPGPDGLVIDKVKQLDGFPAIDLRNGAVLERGAVYVIELKESVRLTNGLEGAANPKSSTGRLDVLTRLTTDHATSFDRIERAYKGPLYLEVAPLTFSIVVREGSRLNQVRFHRGSPSVPGTEIERFYTGGQLVKSSGDLLPLRDNLVPVSVDLVGSGDGGIIGGAISAAGVWH
jgi:dCTP deaminase